MWIVQFVLTQPDWVDWVVFIVPTWRLARINPFDTGHVRNIRRVRSRRDSETMR